MQRILPTPTYTARLTHVLMDYSGERDYTRNQNPVLGTSHLATPTATNSEGDTGVMAHFYNTSTEETEAELPGSQPT